MIILESPAGKRYVEENTPYRKLPDEVVIGSTSKDDMLEFDRQLKYNGLKLGDAVTWVTKKIGLKQCAPCKARQVILNEVGKVGVLETIKRIKETIAFSS